MTNIEDLGCVTNIEVIKHFVSLDGKFVIDAGCGSMTFTRLLLELGARVLAIDPDPVQFAAQCALESLAIPAFQSAHVVTYHNFSQYETFEQFAAHFSSRSFNKLYTEADFRRPEVQEAFERLGGPNHRFTSPKQVTFLQGLKN